MYYLILSAIVSVYSLMFLHPLSDAPVYYCYKTASPLKIDGLLDEEVWQKAPEASFFNADGSAPRQKTIFRWLWDDKYLYGAFYVEDDHIWASMTERDAYLWYENVVEFFINADCSSKSYVEIEINPLNTILDLFVLNKHNNRSDIRQLWNWDCKGLLSAVKIYGTINDESDKDSHWTFEIAIPFDEIYTAPNHPPENGDSWSVTFTRGEGDENPEHPEASSWSPPGFHNPLSYGTLIFREER